MTEANWVSLIALFGALVLAVSAFQGRRVGFSRMAVMALAWIAVFLLVAAIFSAIGPSPHPRMAR
jgi:hypothetical protein